MFETAELGAKVDKADFEAAVPDIRLKLLTAQYELREADFPVVLLLMGDDRIGVNQIVNRLHEWMDARFLLTNFFGIPSDEERERPRFWRYWRVLPPRGRIGVYIGAWALNAIADFAGGKADRDAFEHRLKHIRRFERDLADGGSLVLKFWLHLSKAEFKKRLKKDTRQSQNAQKRTPSTLSASWRKVGTPHLLFTQQRTGR